MEPLRDAFRAEAGRGEMAVDHPVYEACGLSITEPVLLGSGSLNSPLGIFGRDPGRTEIELREPFVGKGGQHIRNGLHRAMHGTNCPSLEASIEVGRSIFWANTVPYKPLGNKAWSMGVKRRFEPMVRELLTQHWSGEHLLTCGRVAFFWFQIADKSLKPELERHWAREDRFESSLSIELDRKRLTLHPLPHPSPLNATWYKRFPELIDLRLRQLQWGESTTAP